MASRCAKPAAHPTLRSPFLCLVTGEHNPYGHWECLHPASSQQLPVWQFQLCAQEKSAALTHIKWASTSKYQGISLGLLHTQKLLSQEKEEAVVNLFISRRFNPVFTVLILKRSSTTALFCWKCWVLFHLGKKIKLQPHSPAKELSGKVAVTAIFKKALWGTGQDLKACSKHPFQIFNFLSALDKAGF